MESKLEFSRYFLQLDDLTKKERRKVSISFMIRTNTVPEILKQFPLFSNMFELRVITSLTHINWLARNLPDYSTICICLLVIYCTATCFRGSKIPERGLEIC